MKVETESWLSGPARKFIFYLLLLFLPTQFGKHFWPDFSYVLGIRVDYLSPTLYFTDILIGTLFVLWIFSKGKFQISNFKFLIKSQVLIYELIFAFFLVGIGLSKSPPLGFYGLVKLLEFVFFGFYTAAHFKDLKKETVLILFSAGILFESLLSIFQFLNHGSLQGIFYFFGERIFNSQTPGIANASLGGALVLRPYGTFSHPNVLAGYLVVVMTLIAGRIMNQELRIKKIALGLILTIGTAALLLTLSRVAVFVWVIICVFCLLRKFMIQNSYFIILFAAALLFLGMVTPLGSRFVDLRLTDEAVVQRGALINNSLAMVKEHSVFGVGLNNFIINLPLHEKIQPVHNIFLLIASETGLVGLGFFAWFLYKTYKRIMIHNSLFIILSSILILGMFDHYPLTLQQGQKSNLSILVYTIHIPFVLHRNQSRFYIIYLQRL